MKKGKSIKLTGYNSYKVTYGTVDSKNLKSIFLSIQTWAEPKHEIEHPVRVVNGLSRNVKHVILEHLDDELFEEKFISDLDLRSSGIHAGKKSFMSLECFFYLRNPGEDFKSNKIRTAMRYLANSIIRQALRKGNTFSYTKTKKDPVNS